MNENADTEHTSFRDEYGTYIVRKIVLIVLCIILSIFLLGFSIYIGGSDIDFARVYSLLIDHLMGHKYETGTIDFIDDYVVWNLRLPRALIGIIAGAGLAAGGAVMQSVMKNPLADPYTTGISSGACFGMAIAIIVGLEIGSGTILGDTGGVLNAFIFAVVPMLLIIVLNQRIGASPTTLILAGVAISYIFNSLTTILMMMTDSETLANVYRWQIGSLSNNLTWNDFPILASVNIVGSIALIMLSSKLNVLTLGDASAKSLGMDADMMRVVCLFIISLMVASIVSYCGIIGFVGLVVPHIIRILIDSDNKFVIPASMALGAVFLISADIAARLISPLDAIPVGVILSFVGSPIFLYLIIRQKKEVW
ncbi:MAG: iron ABC transporter permease [Thermoplasmata archaeon]|nr:iron ABC transporter permease [Thermoplasmata archaeon]MBR4686207.1 iron ABC transporter permease [Candidatus Methanomethylophilaceae archaeon]